MKKYYYFIYFREDDEYTALLYSFTNADIKNGLLNTDIVNIEFVVSSDSAFYFNIDPEFKLSIQDAKKGLLREIFLRG